MLKTTLYRTTTRTNHVTGHGVEGFDSYFQPEGKREQLAINLQESRAERASGSDGPLPTAAAQRQKHDWPVRSRLHLRHTLPPVSLDHVSHMPKY